MEVKVPLKIETYIKFGLGAIFIILSSSTLALDIPAPSGSKSMGENKAIEDSKLKVEAEAKAKAAKDAKLKAEADARFKLEADAKAKAANDAKLKAEAESRMRTQTDSKGRIENKSKSKSTVAEDKVKLENELRLATEARMKAEMDAKATAELRAKAEADMKFAAELKAKAESENKSLNYRNNESVPRSDIRTEQSVYDGIWQANMLCGPNVRNNRPGYSFKKEFKIKDGGFEEQFVNKTQMGTDTENWTGRLANNSIDILVRGKRDNGDSWEIRFSGNAISTTKFELRGGLFNPNQAKVRDCEISFSVIASSFVLASAQQMPMFPQTDPGGKAVIYNQPFQELPEFERPNDATISLYEERRFSLIKSRESQGRLYTIKPKGNAVEYVAQPNKPSETLNAELSKGYILSYLYYEKGLIKYNGKASDGRFDRNIDDEMLFFSHSTGKSINSYVIGHAICEGYISSMDEVIDWPMMSKTLYQGQPLSNLLNMNAGDKHTVDKVSTRVMGSRTHHRDMGLDTIAVSLEGVEKRGNEVFYNNFLSDIIANYVVFKAGDNYDELMRKVFQDKVKIKYAVSYVKHAKTLTNGKPSSYFGEPQTLASYSYFMSRIDFLRVAEAMMKDYQNGTCVGKYLKDAQKQAKAWTKYRPNDDNAKFWIHTHAKKYGAQFYFDFLGMSNRNIFATEGFNGQNMMIDMDNSRIVVTNSAATAWDTRVFILNVIKNGELPK